MKSSKRNYSILVLLAVLFALPGLFAYFYYLYPQWLGEGTINRGTFIDPPVKISKIDGDKWALVYWEPKHCESQCLQQLDKLARVRLSLGRHLYKTEQWLLLKTETPITPTLTKLLTEQDIKVKYWANLERAPFEKENQQVFIADPNHYLILAYSLITAPGDIFHDFQRLLDIKN